MATNMDYCEMDGQMTSKVIRNKVNENEENYPDRADVGNLVRAMSD